MARKSGSETEAAGGGLRRARDACIMSAMQAYGELPQWAPRVEKEKIRRLYELDAAGMPDDELLDDVGWALLARCESFIAACRASQQGEAPCARCGEIVHHNRGKEEILRCGKCGWELPWADYFATIQHKQLSGAEPVLDLFAEFVRVFPNAASPREKMFRIDRLLNGFHYWAKAEQDTRPVAVNLIQGKLPDVIEFLDSLSRGENSTPGVVENHTEWVRRSQWVRGFSMWGAKNWFQRHAGQEENGINPAPGQSPD